MLKVKTRYQKSTRRHSFLTLSGSGVSVPQIGWKTCHKVLCRIFLVTTKTKYCKMKPRYSQLTDSYNIYR